MENNKQLGPLYQMETFSDPVVKNLSPPMHTITTLKLQHNFVFVLFFFLNCLFRSSVSSQITLQQELFHLPAGVCYKSPSPERSQKVMDGVAGHQEKKKKKPLHPLKRLCHVCHLIRGDIMQSYHWVFQHRWKMVYPKRARQLVVYSGGGSCALETSLFLICAFYQHLSSQHAEHCLSHDLLFPVDRQQ